MLRVRWLLATLCCGCFEVDVPGASDTNAVRCACGCGVGMVTMTRTVDVCLGQDVEPSAASFTARDLEAFCDGACAGGVQAQAQESLVAERVIDDACFASCSRAGAPTGLQLEQCMAPDHSGRRIDCEADACPVDLPGGPNSVHYYLTRCTQVIDDSRIDPSACGPDRPTKPLCMIDIEDAL
jgi:hypothetical protein